MNFCEECGNKLESGESKCSKCGFVVKTTTVNNVVENNLQNDETLDGSLELLNFCTDCGAKIEKKGAFCTNCGKKLLDSKNEGYENKTENLKNINNTEILEIETTERLIEDENNTALLNEDIGTILLNDNNEYKTDVDENIEKNTNDKSTWRKKFKEWFGNRENKIEGSKASPLIRKIILITLIVFVLCGIGTVAYSQITKPERYKKQVSLGNKYLSENKYSEAVIEFLKAIKIDPKNIESRMGLANAYIHLDKLEEAEEVLLQALKIDKMNKDILLMLIDLWKESKPQELYKILEEYIKNAGSGADETIKRIYESMRKSPVLPKASLPSGRYTDNSEVKITMGDQEGANLFYYTIDGTEPSEKNGKFYKKPIPINQGHTTIKVIAINALNVSSGVATFEYDVDEGYKDSLIELVKQAQVEHDGAEEGKEVGKYQEGSKAILLQAIQSSQEVINKKTSTQTEVDDKHSELTIQLYEFKRKKIPESNKNELSSTINKAKQLLASSTEGSNDGQVKPGSKSALSSEISKAESVLNNNMATQQEVDTASMNLKNAISNFEKARIRLIVNPDGSNFTYGFKTLMGDATTKIFRGRFKVVRSGTAKLYQGTKDVYKGETGTIEITLTRTNNKVTVYAIETWDKDVSYIYTMGTWYAEYDGANNKFKLYPDIKGYTDRFEGVYTNGTMTGVMYIQGIGYYMDFTAQ